MLVSRLYELYCMYCTFYKATTAHALSLELHINSLLLELHIKINKL